jgi:hypothetical protein
LPAFSETPEVLYPASAQAQDTLQAGLEERDFAAVWSELDINMVMYSGHLWYCVFCQSFSCQRQEFGKQRASASGLNRRNERSCLSQAGMEGRCYIVSRETGLGGLGASGRRCTEEALNNNRNGMGDWAMIPDRTSSGGSSEQIEEVHVISFCRFHTFASFSLRANQAASVQWFRIVTLYYVPGMLAQASHFTLVAHQAPHSSTHTFPRSYTPEL